MPESLLLLDTHCWIWMQFGEAARFKPGSLTAINKAGESGLLRLSAISVWEVALLESKGKLALRKECSLWVAEALATPGLSLVPLTPEIAIHSTRLPGGFHGDPADRIITATARVLGAKLMTADRRLIEYGNTKQVGIVPA